MSSKRALLYSLLISLAIAIFVEHRVFYDPTAINDDVRNQIYWMARFIDPSYFSNDYIAAYFTQPSMISPIVGPLYQFLSHFADPKLATQFLVFPIIIFTTFFLFKAAEAHERSQILFEKFPDARHASPENAELTETSMSSSRDEHNKADGTLRTGSQYAFWVCFIFNLYIWTMKYTAGALPRSYFYLLFFLFLWLLTAKRWNWLVVCFTLQALIYPTAFFVSVLTLILEIFQDKKTRGSFDPAQIQTVFMGALAATTVFYFRYLRHHASQFGSMPSLAEALKMPEFYIDGRACVFILPFKFSTQFLPSITICLLLIIGSYFLIKKLLIRKLPFISTPRYLWTSAAASLFLFVLAHFVLFYLYLPHRYITYVLPLIPIFILGSILYQLDIKLAHKPLSIWLIAILCLALIYPHWNDDLIEIPGNEQQLYKFLKTVPSDALIAAPLKLASNIPAFSYRSVLVSSETNIPFHKNYYKEIQARTKALDLIYSSKNNTELTNIIQKYNIKYIVIDLKQNPDTALKNIPDSQVVYSTKKYLVVSTSFQK